MFTQPFQYHRSQIAWFSWLSVIVGILAVPQLIVWIVIAAIVSRTHGWRRWLLFGWLITCNIVGTWRYDSFIKPTTLVDESSLAEQGVVVTIPQQQEGGTRVVIQLPNQERVQVDSPDVINVQYGDKVSAQCTLNLPEPIEGFAYDKYLARYHISATCRNALIEVIEHNQGNVWLAAIYQWRAWLQQRVERMWPSPVSGLILGVLIGAQDTIPDTVYTDFQRAGVVHILVVSGMHVLLLVQTLTSITKTLPRKLQTQLIVFALIAFCALTGFSSTVIRAAVMGCIPVLGRVVGRPTQPHLVITWAVGLMGVANPYILVHDVGFQLSLLATLGLVYVLPMIRPYGEWLPEFGEIKDTITTSVAATITTAPFIALTFGTWSHVALLANLFVLPISNLMLFAGAAIVACSVLSTPLASVLATLLEAFVALMLHGVQWLASLPGGYVEGLTPSVWFVLFSYLVIGCVVWQKRSRAFVRL